MKLRSAEYRIGESIFGVQYGDITTFISDVIVSSDDNYLTMGGGVSYAISRAAGAPLITEARKQLPLRLGDVAVTSSGDLGCKYIFHAVTIDHDSGSQADGAIIRAMTHRCFELATNLRVKSIVFPALGTGVARLPFQQCADAMIGAIVQGLEKGVVERATVALFQRTGVEISSLNSFYERAIAIASVASGKMGLLQNVEALRLYVEANGGHELSKRFRDFESLLVQGQPIIKSQSADLYVEAATVARATESLAENENWDLILLEEKLLQTKYAGCMAQLNINMLNLNNLEVDMAKYGGFDIPPRLKIAVSDLRLAVEKLENQATELRERRAKLKFRHE